MMRDIDKFGTNHSIGDKLRATVVDESPDSYFVEYPNGDYAIEPRTEKNRILFESDLVEDPDDPVIDVAGRMGATADAIDVGFYADFEANKYVLVVDGDRLTLGDDRAFDVLRIVADDVTDDSNGGAVGEEAIGVWDDASNGTTDDSIPSSFERGTEENPWTVPDVDRAMGYDIVSPTAEELYELYMDIMSTRVRQDVVEQYLDRFNNAVEVTDEGWVIHDDVLVTYEAENYLLEDLQAHEVKGSSTIEADGKHQFLQLSFDTSREVHAQIGDTNSDLTEREQEFLATVEVLYFPEEYLEQELLHKVEQAYLDRPDTLVDIADTARVGSFMDPVSGLIHRHDINKHTLSATFSVNRWVVDELHYSAFDHAGVHELIYREQEFRDADRSVFWDTDNDDEQRWESIRSVGPRAPVPDSVHRDLRARYGSSGTGY